MTLRVGIITASDRSARGERPDTSGPRLQEAVRAQGWEVVRTQILPDDFEALRSALTAWCDAGEMDVLLVTGGTGFAPRDVTPEATLAASERLAPGLAEAMRAASLARLPTAMLSRGVCAIRGRTLIIDLPGSPAGALENFAVVVPVLPHAVHLLRDEDAGH